METEHICLFADVSIFFLFRQELKSFKISDE